MKPDVLAKVRASRREQGLPERLEDPAALDTVAALLTASPAGLVALRQGAREVRHAA